MQDDGRLHSAPASVWTISQTAAVLAQLPHRRRSRSPFFFAWFTVRPYYSRYGTFIGEGGWKNRTARCCTCSSEETRLRRSDSEEILYPWRTSPAYVIGCKNCGFFFPFPPPLLLLFFFFFLFYELYGQYVCSIISGFRSKVYLKDVLIFKYFQSYFQFFTSVLYFL